MSRVWQPSVLSLLLAFGTASCGESLRRPPRGPVPADLAYQTVDYPPPPAVVETVSPDPGEPCVWLDGHYEWSGRRWQWQAGAWVRPPLACHYVPVTMLRRSGELLYAAPQWAPGGNDDSSAVRRSCPQPQACPVAR